jgi:hypothetical protein
MDLPSMDRRARKLVARCAFGALLSCVASLAIRARAEELGLATYVRSDTDDTLVVAPRLRGKLQLTDETSTTLIYAVDVWTSASIDIVTSASPIPVTEQRDEINVSVDHELSDLTFTGAYRLSLEPDYESHGVSGGVGYDFADNNAQLAFGASVSSDTVGRAGSPSFAEGITTAGGRISFTQVLGRSTVAQGQYELSRAQGYLASAYRYVGIGAPGGCRGFAPLCVPETAPSSRLRHAAAIFGKHSLSDAISLGAGYRLYLDDWGLTAHTVRAEVGFLPSAETVLLVRYRFYMQGAANHYRPVYLVPADYVTSDKELSPLSSHRLGLEIEQVFPLSGGEELTGNISIAPIYYSYDDFPLLDSITAFELNLALGVVL